MKSTLLLSLFLVAIIACGQDIKFVTGTQMSNRQFYRRIFFDKERKLGFLVDDIVKPSSTQLNNFINYNRPIPLKPDFGNAAYYVHNLSFANGKTYAVYSILDKKTKVQTAYVAVTNLDLTILETPKKLGSFEGIRRSVFQSTPISNEDPTDIEVTPLANGEMLLIKKKETSIEAIAFHPAKGILWNKIIEIEKNKHYVLNSIRFDTLGNIYFLGHYFGKKLQDPFLVVCSPAGNNIKYQTFPSGERIEDFGYQLYIGTDGLAYVAGLYHNKKENEIGFKVFKIDPRTFEAVGFSKSPLPEQYAKITRAYGYDADDFGVRNIVALKNGNLVFSIEGLLMPAGIYVDMYTAYFSSTVALVVSIDMNGQVKWTTQIAKVQSQPKYLEYVGHVLATRNNKVYMIYNDNLANFALSPVDKQENWRVFGDTYVALVEIDESGNARKLPAISPNKNVVSSIQNVWGRPMSTIEDGLYHFLIGSSSGYKFAVFGPAVELWQADDRSTYRWSLTLKLPNPVPTQPSFEMPSTTTM